MAENVMTRLSGAFANTSNQFNNIAQLQERRTLLEEKRKEAESEQKIGYLKFANGIIDHTLKLEDPKARKAYAAKMIPLANKYFATAGISMDLDPTAFDTSAGVDAFNTITNSFPDPTTGLPKDPTITPEMVQAAIPFLDKKGDPTKGFEAYRQLKAMVTPTRLPGGETVPFGDVEPLIKGSGGGMSAQPGTNPDTGTTEMVVGPKADQSALRMMVQLMGTLGAAQGSNPISPRELAAQAHSMVDEAVKTMGGTPAPSGGALTVQPPTPVPSPASGFPQAPRSTSSQPTPSPTSVQAPTDGGAPLAPAPPPQLIRFKPQTKLDPVTQRELTGYTVLDRSLIEFGDQYKKLSKKQGKGFAAGAKALMAGRAVGPFFGTINNLAGDYPAVAKMFGIGEPETAARARLRATGGYAGFKAIKTESGVQYSDKQQTLFNKFLPKTGDSDEQIEGKITALRGINAMAGVTRMRVAKASGTDIEEAKGIALALTKGLKGDFGIGPDDIVGPDGLIDDVKHVTAEEADMLMILPPDLKRSVIKRIEELENANRP